MAQDKKTVMIVIPPDGGFGWIVVFFAFWLTFVLDGCLMTFSIYKSVLKKDLHVSEMDVMSIYSAQLGVYFLSGPLTSLIIQACGFRIACVIGILITTVGFVTASFTSNFALTLLSYGVFGGFGLSLAFSPAIIIVSYYFDKYRAIATGIVLCGSAFGGVFVSYSFLHFLEHYGRANTFRLQAGLVTFSMLFVFVFRMPEMTEIEVQNENDAMAAAANPYMSTVSLGRVIEMKRDGFKSVYNVIDVGMAQEPQSVWQRYCRCFGCKADNKDADYRTQPLDRQDIFFAGSVADLDRITSQSRHHSLSRAKISRVASKHVVIKDAKTDMKKCHICPESVRITMDRLLDLKLFKSPSFCLLLLSMFLWMFGLYPPYNYITDRALENHIDAENSHLLLQAISVGNIIGGILAGLSSFVPQLEATSLTLTCTGLAGILTIASNYVEPNGVIVQFAFAIGYGIFACELIFSRTMASDEITTASQFVCTAFAKVLRSVLYVKYMGLESLTSVYGLGSMAMGVAALAGTPLAQAIQTSSHNYGLPFLFSGIAHLACCVSFLALKIVNKWEHRHKDDRK